MNKGLIIGGIGLIVIGLFWFNQPRFGISPSLEPRVATSSANVVGTTVATVLASSTGCAARIISTAGQAIMITFDDRYTATGAFGQAQFASTTVVYDSSAYGCGEWKIYGHTGNSTINVTETR